MALRPRESLRRIDDGRRESKTERKDKETEKKDRGSREEVNRMIIGVRRGRGSSYTEGMRGIGQERGLRGRLRLSGLMKFLFEVLIFYAKGFHFRLHGINLIL
jgi:hypothetical protein